MTDQDAWNEAQSSSDGDAHYDAVDDVRATKRVSRNAVLTSAGTVVVAAALGWIGLSPYMALSSLREAVASNDTAELSELVDFPALKEQLHGELMSDLVLEKDMAQIQLLGIPLVDLALSKIASPGGFRQLAASQAFFDGTRPLPGGLVDWEIERRGLSRFYAKNKQSSEGLERKFVFRREGLTWRMVGMYTAKVPSIGAAIPLSSPEHQLDPATLAQINDVEAAAAASASLPEDLDEDFAAEAEPETNFNAADEAAQAEAEAAAAAADDVARARAETEDR